MSSTVTSHRTVHAPTSLALRGTDVVGLGLAVQGSNMPYPEIPQGPGQAAPSRWRSQELELPLGNATNPLGSGVPGRTCVAC